MAEISGELSAVLASIDTLRAAGEDVLSRVTPEDFAESRQCSLRRHAIETGIARADLRYRLVALRPPPEEQASYWWRQVRAAARQAGFYVNRTGGYWWVRLHVTVFGQTLRYLVIVQKAGHGETGVLAVTAYADSLVSLPSRCGTRRTRRG